MAIGKKEDRVHKLVLKPIVGLTQDLPKADLEQITVEAVVRHRQLRDLAEERYQHYQGPLGEGQHRETLHAARIDYVSAMIAMHAQQTVLSTLLDVLGYMPTISPDRKLEL